MFYRKKDENKNSNLEALENFQLKPDFFEKNILIPVITRQTETISFLFDEIDKIHNQLQNEESEYTQQYVKDFDSMMGKYYLNTFKRDNVGIREQAKKDAKKARELLLNGISSHLEQYMNNLKDLGEVSSQENNIKKISEYMIKIQAFMFNITQMKNKIFNIVLPMTTLTFVDSKTKKEIQRLHSDNPVTRIGLLPFEIIIDEVALLCENGIKSIDSWFDHLKNKRIQYLETIVNQSKVQAAQEQAKAAKWTFYTQLGFMILSVLFIIVSFCLTEYKENWIDFFKLLINRN